MSTPAVRHPGEFRWETRLLGVMTLVLTAMGVASCYAVGSYMDVWFHEATQQAIAAVVGGVLFVVAARLDYRIWKRVSMPLLLATVAGLVVIGIVAAIYRGKSGPGMVAALVPAINHAHRWLKIGPERIQVAEIARFTLPLWLASQVANLGARVRDFGQGFAPLMGTVAVICGLVAIEPSVTMATALGVVCAIVVLTAGARVPHLVGLALVAGALGFVVLKVDTVRKARAETFSGRSLDCITTDQACEALIGFGGGGIIGVGYGRGTQKMGHTADAYSDYLLSVIGEEEGFAGVCFLFLCYAVFCWMGFRIARTAPDAFGTYLASGLTGAVGVTAFMHAAVVTWLMPATGITLPFMSVGRVSLLLYLLSAGILVSIGRQRGKPARST